MCKLSLISKRLLTLGFALACAMGHATAAEPDKLLPAETDAVLTVNLKALLESAAVKKYALAELKKEIAKNEPLAGALKALNFDPLKDLHSIMLAVSNPEESVGLVIVRGNFDRDKLQFLLDLIAGTDQKKFGVSEHGKIKIYQAKEGDHPGFGAVLDKETLVFSTRKTFVEKAIDQNQGKGKGKIKLKKELAAVLKKVDAEQTIWLAIGATEQVKEAVRKNPDVKVVAEKLQGAVAGLTVKNGFDLDLALYTSDPDAVKALEADLEKGKEALLAAVGGVPDYGPILLDILKEVTVKADAGTLRVRGEVSGEIIERVIKQAKGQ